MGKQLSENDPKEPKKSKYKYLTLVLKYFDKGNKTSYDVTEVTCTLLTALKTYNNNCNYDDARFDLYGMCVEEETDIADGKNDFIQSIKNMGE